MLFVFTILYGIGLQRCSLDAIVRSLQDSLAVLSVELIPIHEKLVTIRRQLVALAAKDGSHKAELKPLQEELRKIDSLSICPLNPCLFMFERMWCINVPANCLIAILKRIALQKTSRWQILGPGRNCPSLASNMFLSS
jgi:hypothetical protein